MLVFFICTISLFFFFLWATRQHVWLVAFVLSFVVVLSRNVTRVVLPFVNISFNVAPFFIYTRSLIRHQPSWKKLSLFPFYWTNAMPQKKFLAILLVLCFRPTKKGRKLGANYGHTKSKVCKALCEINVCIKMKCVLTRCHI